MGLSAGVTPIERLAHEMLEEEWAGMNEWVSSRRRDWLWDSIRWMMAELDRWPPSPLPRWLAGLDSRLHHDGVVVWDLVLHGIAWAWQPWSLV